MAYLILIGLAWFAFRLITRPYKNCRHCHGMGRIATRTGHGRPRPCRRCKGTGLKVRASTRVVGSIGHHVRAASDRETGRGTGRIVSDADLDATLADIHAKSLAAITERVDLDAGWQAIMRRTNSTEDA